MAGQPSSKGVGAAHSIPALQLSIDHGGWRVHGPADLQDPRKLSAALQVLARDDFTCRHCEFRSVPDRDAVPAVGEGEANERATAYMGVHPRNGDHGSYRLDDLYAICPFCHEVLHCGVGTAANSGLIILCPWMSQADICLLMNAMAVGMASDGANAIVIARLWAHMESLQFEAQSLLGVQRLDPGLLASGLLKLREMSPQLYAKREKAIGALRYMPNRDAFAQAVAYWKAAAWRPMNQWQEVYERWLQPQTK